MPVASKSSNRSSARSVKVKEERSRSSKPVKRVDSSDEENSSPSDAAGSDDRDNAPAEDDDEEEEEASVTARGQKRSRTNEKGDALNKDRHGKGRASTHDDSPDEAAEEEEIAPPTQTQRAKLEPLPRDKDGYIAGSIVRVKLWNFLTYEGPVEFFPSAHLNLILGPNGTGKSSVVCAIALGLGFPTKTLGRAERLGSYVKNGATKGWCEIELKGFPGKKNSVIRREINDQNASTWHLDGKVVPMKEITSKVTSYNIQAENLCAFIPQEKVSEFARMTPKELLIQTERAAGDPNLSDWHANLIELGADLTKHMQESEGDAGDLKRLEDKNKELEKDVARWKERMQLEKEVELYDLGVLSLEYKESKTLYDITKAEKEALNARFEHLRSRNRPMMDLKEELQAKVKGIQDQRAKEDERTKAKYNLFQKKHHACEKEATTAEELTNQMAIANKKEQLRKQKIANLKEEIVSLEEKIANPPEVEDEAELNQELAHCKKEMDTARLKYDALASEAREHADVTGKCRAELANCKQELQDLSNVSKRRLESLRVPERDTVETIEWLRKPENRARFKMEITEPAYVSLDVPNLAYVDQVEACISWGQMKTFVASCFEDYNLLNRLVNDSTEVLGRRGRITVWFRPQNYSRLTEPPMSAEMMQEIGFDGYALDFVNAPEGLKWYLQMELNMHRTAIAKDATRVDPQRAIDAISRGGSGSFIIGTTMSRVAKSHYGKRLTQTGTQTIRPARNLRFEAVDPNLKRDLEARIAAQDAILEEQKAGEVAIGEKQKEHNKVMADIKRVGEAVQARKSTRQKLLQEHARLATRLDSVKGRLAAEERQQSSEGEKQKLKKEIAAIAERRAALVVEISVLATEILQFQANTAITNLRWLQAAANSQALERLSATYNGALTKAHAAHEQKKLQLEAALADSREKIALLRAKRAQTADEIADQWQLLQPNMTLDQVRDELAERKAKLETILVMDPDVINQFEQREAQIETLKNTLASKKRREDSLKRNIDRVYAKWYPALSELVENIGEKFSSSFHAIGCAGEIRLGKDESYKEWRIDIYVKFRDETELQLLTGHRQSGGERSLTTIMYLMSLTEYSRTPFSLVDEINQGMDAKAERVVHNQLVNVTCNKNSGQYFLVTPKLLQNLQYHERMKVLLVCNGGGFPDEPQCNDLGALVRARIARNGH